jgi:acetamidase/formamidase
LPFSDYGITETEENMSRFFLQSGIGPIPGDHYLTSKPEEIQWGWLPNRDSAPALKVPSGATVTIDTVSHEGLMEDQGSDPVAYLAQFGVGSEQVLNDAQSIAREVSRDPEDGPHVVTGPIAVEGAEPGDLLKIDVLVLDLRAPYGFISSRHGFGALPDEFPDPEGSEYLRTVDRIVAPTTISHFNRVEDDGGTLVGVMDAGKDRTLRFPLNPFLGLMGVAPDTSSAVPSVPPGDHGGNIDIKEATAGTTLYLPVQSPGAGFYVGDPHFAQGNGEVALTALEAPLRATVRLTVISATDAARHAGILRNPLLETPTHWIPCGMDEDLDEAMRKAVRNAVIFLNTNLGVPRQAAMAYLSAASDFEISQVVDAVKGVHCKIRKADFAHWF